MDQTRKLKVKWPQTPLKPEVEASTNSCWQFSLWWSSTALTEPLAFEVFEATLTFESDDELFTS